MSIRCALGIHDWKRVVRHSARKVVVVIGIGLFVAPALTHWPTVAHQCRRCGKRVKS